MDKVLYYAITQPYAAKVNCIISNVIVENGNRNVSTIAIWDTGAMNSVISSEVAKDLNLIPTGKMKISTPSDKNKEVNTYLVDIILPNNVKVFDVQVCDSAIGGQKIGALIGMDIITLGDFCISNFQNKTTFSFRMPSKEITDYKKQSIIDNLTPTHGKGKRKK